jgi:hypothetical protein
MIEKLKNIFPLNSIKYSIDFTEILISMIDYSVQYRYSHSHNNIVELLFELFKVSTIKA